MNMDKGNLLICVGLVIGTASIALAWVGYEKFGYELLLGYLPLCG